jgi:hypothetical protein
MGALYARTHLHPTLLIKIFEKNQAQTQGEDGGHDWDRTSDHCHVKAVLYR